MPRFFLDIEYRLDRTEDEDGADYADLAATRADAEYSLREMVANAIRLGRSAPLAMTVRDNFGNQAAIIHILDILPPGLFEK